MDVTVDQARSPSLEDLRRAWPSVPSAAYRRRLEEQAARPYLRAGLVPAGVLSTCTYRGVGDDGAERTPTETSGLPVLPPGPPARATGHGGSRRVRDVGPGLRR